ncbi:ribose 5-phosphate isomerase A [Luminiphilus syltensis NOR5-1B]|uniref:Ribose-5-phosphate isomerase A n=1 Tax=Luminiphilus syltensis NOR5-1B TaxID=565045 RepID=B8KU64_9GAMM|nr:ribose-5-phosphate isomerase RpiA [Luminiphilus syltensis]EED36972.1 ribose 5-phosphate isomerase A [Luminiphilus syltensis NOR5-1B]
MDKAQLKAQVAAAAIERVAALHNDDLVLGIGTGSTAEAFIQLLGPLRARIDTTVSSSERSSTLLREMNIPVSDLNAVGEVDIYVDGADEANADLQLIKGGGAALTREKIVAGASRQFICIADESKLVPTLGAFPLPVEVIPMARSYVARQIVALGGQPVWREDVVTDNGNVILDVFNLLIDQPLTLEGQLNDIPGVVCNGLFALRAADELLLGTPDGVRSLTR